MNRKTQTKLLIAAIFVTLFDIALLSYHLARRPSLPTGDATVQEMAADLYARGAGHGGTVEDLEKYLESTTP